MEPLNTSEYYFLNNSSLISEINNLKSTIDSLKPIDRIQENRIMQKFRLDWNYNSNAIEGNSLDYGETAAFLMHGITAKGKPLKDYLDIKGHNEVIDYLSYIIKNKEQLSERDIRSMHQMLLVEPYESPAQTEEGLSVKKTIRIGEYKRLPNHVKTITGEIHYYASAEDTPILMGELIEWYRSVVSNADIHPLIIASVFHHRFTSIHPFDDGNGRMSRLLMNLILMQYDYPPVVIKNSDKNDYYLTLSQADTGDIEPFVNFIGSNLNNSLNLYLKGARGESIEEQSDLKKKLVLFKKEVESRGDRIELQKTPETLKDTFDKSILPFLNEVSIVLSDFKDLFFYYEEKYVSLSTFPDNGWVYRNENISSELQNLFYNDTAQHIEVVAYQFSNFKLAENSFSVELKLAFMMENTDYSIFYSFSEVNELDRTIGTMYSQWMTSSVSKKYYHQFISPTDIEKMVNKIGEEFYDYNRTVFDKTKHYEFNLNLDKITDIWNSFLLTYNGINNELISSFANSSNLEIRESSGTLIIRVSSYVYSTLSIEERIHVESSFFRLLNKEIQSTRKVFVKMLPV